MKKRKPRYYGLINLLVILATLGLFVWNYHNAYLLFDPYAMRALAVLAVSVLFVHIIKGTRLYLALYGSDINGNEFIKTYCKVIPVSIIFPYKLGELFRMYCYGQQIGNKWKGIIIILFDRFMDTLALLTVIIVMLVFGGGKTDLLVYLLLVFLILVFAFYYTYPKINVFWKQYFIKSKATKRKLDALKYLDMVNAIYRETESVVGGRGIFLYFLSLAAWGVEIGCLYILGMINGTNDLSHNIFEYLRSALGMNQSLELRRFIFVSVLLLMFVYLILKLKDITFRMREKE